jgi:hypothetical protein
VGTRLGVAGAVERDHHAAAGRLALAPERLVHDDPCEPSGELRAARERADRPVCQEIGGLEAILSFGIVAEDAARDAKEHAVVPAHDRLEGAEIA